MAGGVASPFRLSIIPVCSSAADQAGYVASAAFLPMVAGKPLLGQRLAIVGGGASTLEQVDALASWDGPIWAINSMAGWLARRGIRAVMASIDSLPMPGHAEALLASCCHPDTVAACGSVQAFHLAEHAPGGLPGGTTTACRLPLLALRLGCVDITLIGCEGSFSDIYHVDRGADGPPEQLIIRAGGRDYRTEPPLLLQCQALAEILSAAPGIVHNRSGGLLRAMAAHPDTWEVVAVSAALKSHLEAVNGRCGLYDAPYEAAA